MAGLVCCCLLMSWSTLLFPSATLPLFSDFVLFQVFVYLAGLQMLLFNGRASLLGGACGAVAGLIQRSSLFGLAHLTTPTMVQQCLSSTIGALLAGAPPAPPTSRSSRTPGAAAVGTLGRNVTQSSNGASVPSSQVQVILHGCRCSTIVKMCYQLPNV
jgi:hypothetical protein